VAFSPGFDVRESDSAFFLEGEFPGIERKEDITIEKLGPRTLLVESSMARFDLGAEWGQPALAPLNPVRERKVERHHSHVKENRGTARERGQEGEDRRSNSWSEEQGPKENADGLHVRLAERHVGYLQRSFTFPSPVDIDALKARLRHGLLVIMIPKMRDGKHDPKKIEIED